VRGGTRGTGEQVERARAVRSLSFFSYRPQRPHPVAQRVDLPVVVPLQGLGVDLRWRGGRDRGEREKPPAEESATARENESAPNAMLFLAYSALTELPLNIAGVRRSTSMHWVGGGGCAMQGAANA